MIGLGLSLLKGKSAKLQPATSKQCLFFTPLPHVDRRAMLTTNDPALPADSS